jgi:hypothetical protein
MVATDAVTRPSSRRNEALSVALVLLGVVGLQASAIGKAFFADDYLFLEQVRGRSLWGALTSQDPLGNFLRPVSRQAWFWLFSRLGGESPALFHAANLFVFLLSLVVLYSIVRRVASPAAATIAIAFLGFQYASDVPLHWASGSQDLLALLFALLAIDLQARGRSVLAAVALALGLLSKEVVAGTALLAVLAAHRPDETMRSRLGRGVPLFVVTLGWGIWWAASMSAHASAIHALAINADGAFAVVMHLVQVAAGLEFRLGGQPLGHWSAMALIPALIAGVAAYAVIIGGGESRRRLGGFA